VVDELGRLPDGLPQPIDDGAAEGLVGKALPAVALASSAGGESRLDLLTRPAVLFTFPRAGRPGTAPLGGWDAWNAIPGARGCTPQACGFRDLRDEFERQGHDIFGVSTQPVADLVEIAGRLHLPYALLSDSEGKLRRELGLPMFVVQGVTLLRRMTLFLAGGRIRHVLYPVFPPDQGAEQALQWMTGEGRPGRL
jgi:peroxiredoxin